MKKFTTFSVLRAKIVLVIQSLVTFCLLFALLFLNMELFLRERNFAKTFLTSLLENDGKFIDDKESFSDYMNFRNYFSLKLNESGDILEIVSEFQPDFTFPEINLISKNLLSKIIENPKIDHAHKGGLVAIWKKTQFGFFVCIINRRGEVLSLQRLRKVSVLIFVSGFIFSFLISILISSIIVRPVEIAFKKQREFISNAGHELKTPISVIGANLDVLEIDLKGNRWLGYIRQENERMGKLVKNLLYLARNDYEKNEIRFMELDFAQIVKNAALPFESIFFEEGKTLRFEIQNQISILADEMQIKQIVIILIDNALKNSNRGGFVSVRCFCEDKKAVLKVRNTGRGIKQEDLERIFERFYRSDDSRSRQTGGYGLGLSIARTIAESHNGSLFAESVFGEWAEFTLILPKSKNRAESYVEQRF